MKCRHLLLLGAACLVSGCGPQLSREELGQVIFNVPTVPGSATPYPLPDGESSDEVPTPPGKDETAESGSQ